MNKPVFTAHQPSMTEWFAALGELELSNAFRIEDAHKMNRLAVLAEVIGLPYRKPVVFSAREVWDEAPAFLQLLKERGDQPTAFRLSSDDPALPKLRNRGHTMQICYQDWFRNLTIDLDKYKVEIFPDEPNLAWSTIFIINQDGVTGEIIAGKHSQLSQGETQQLAIQFRYANAEWDFSDNNPEVLQELKRTIATLHVREPDKQQVLKDQLDADFANDYLVGYFETVVPPDGNVYFIDYNRILASRITTSPSNQKDSGDSLVRGATAQSGYAEGIARVVAPEDIETAIFNDGDILVCDNTDVRYLPLMRKAGAMVTNRGGILSHAAIIARELKKPCVIGTRNATDILTPGTIVRVDANTGQIVVLS